MWLVGCKQPTLRVDGFGGEGFAGFHEDGGGDAVATWPESALRQGNVPAASGMFGDIQGNLPDTRFMRQCCDDTPRRRTLNANEFQSPAPFIQEARIVRKRLLKS